MGFKYTAETIKIVIGFAIVIFGSSFWMAKIGSKMFNDLGNAPSKAEEIQLKAFWKVFIGEVIALVILVVFFQVFS